MECTQNFCGGYHLENIHVKIRELCGRVIIRWFVKIGHEWNYLRTLFIGWFWYKLFESWSAATIDPVIIVTCSHFMTCSYEHKAACHGSFSCNSGTLGRETVALNYTESCIYRCSSCVSISLVNNLSHHGAKIGAPTYTLKGIWF